MKKLFALLITFNLLFIIVSCAQNIEWQNTIGGINYDDLVSITQTSDGGYILGGSSMSDVGVDKTQNCYGDYDYWIVKTDSAGNLQWQNTIGGSNRDLLSCIRQTTDNGYIIGGYSSSGISGNKTENSNGYTDFWIVKTDSTGNIQWQNTIGGDTADILTSILQTYDGGYIFGGESWSHISGDKTENRIGYCDYWVVKTDSAGNIQWQNTIGGSGYDVLKCIQQTPEGGYILGGHSQSGMSGDKTEFCQGLYDYWIIKIDSIGNIQWQNTIGGNLQDNITSVMQSVDGGYIVGGFSESNISGDKTENHIGYKDYWIVKTNSTGIIQWQNTIGGTGDDLLFSVRQAPDGGYVLGGYSDSDISGDKTENSDGYHDYWIVKTNSTGIIQWQNTIGGNTNDNLYSLEITTDNGYIFGGYSFSNISGDKTENCLGNSDYWVVKLGPDSTTLISDFTSADPDLKIYPNPVHDELNIQLHQKTNINQLVTISVFDVLGKVILNKQFTANCKLQTTVFSSGVYFLEVKAGREIYRSKFVKE